MDKATPQVREYLAKRADLLGAIRLPKNTFSNTEVTTDIIFLQKREQIREKMPNWNKQKVDQDKVKINKKRIDQLKKELAKKKHEKNE